MFGDGERVRKHGVIITDVRCGYIHAVAGRWPTSYRKMRTDTFLLISANAVLR